MTKDEKTAICCRIGMSVALEAVSKKNSLVTLKVKKGKIAEIGINCGKMKELANELCNMMGSSPIRRNLVEEFIQEIVLEEITKKLKQKNK